MAFQAGISGNSRGRPKGTGSRQQVFSALIEPYKEALFKKALDMALDGNETMLRLFLDRMLPAKPTVEPVQIDMPDTRDFNNIQTISHFGRESLEAVIAGKITPEEAVRISVLLNAHYRLFGVVKLMEEMEAFKAKYKDK